GGGWVRGGGGGGGGGRGGGGRGPPRGGVAAMAARSTSITATDCRPATVTCRPSPFASASPSRPDKSSATSARPGARPDRTCTTKRGLKARRSTRRNSCARGKGSPAACEAISRVYS